MPWSMEPVDLHPTLIDATLDRIEVACTVDLEADDAAELPAAAAVRVHLFPRGEGEARAAILGKVRQSDERLVEGARAYHLAFAAPPPGRYQLVMSWTDADGLAHREAIAWPGSADGLVHID